MEGVTEAILIVVGVLLTVGTGFFVAAEFALINLDRRELEGRADGGESGLGPTIRALKVTSTHLSGAQVGITVTTLLTGYTLEPSISRLLREPLRGLGVPDGAVVGVGSTVGLLLATALSMIIGELMPKNLAIAEPLRTAKIAVPFQIVFTTAFRPLIALFNGTANAVISSMGIEPKEELSGARSAEELRYLIQHSAKSGMLPENDAELLGRTLRLASFDAADLLTPRVRMVTVADTDTAEQVMATAIRSGRSRLPVVAGSPDDIVGLVHVKQAFAVDPADRSTTSVRDLMTDPVRVPQALPADTLLARLRDEGAQFAVVTDEYGGTEGIVTLEDLVEELVGELEDEHDPREDPVAEEGESFVFDAGLRPDELAERIGVPVPEGEWDTVGGYVMAELGRVPAEGEQLCVAEGTLRVDRVKGPRLLRLRYTPDPLGPADVEHGSDTTASATDGSVDR